MADSTMKNSEGLVTYTVYSDGNKIKDLFELISVAIYKEINRIGKATLIFAAGDMPKQNVPESEDETFAPGKKIRIEAGYKSVENVIFEGIITSHNIHIHDVNDTTMEIECRDYAFPATLTRKNRIFEKEKDSAAISTILGEYSPLNVSVDATSTIYNELVQYYCTDWDFILSRADANGLVVITEGKDISIKKPKVATTPVLKVSYGNDLIGFKGNLQASYQTDQIEALAWNSATQKIINVKGSAPTLNKQGNSTPSDLAKAVGRKKWTLQTDCCSDEPSLKAWADGQLLKTGLARIQGEVKFQGNAKAVLGCVIEIDGLGKRFNGNIYVGSVEHDIKDGEWITTVGIGISPANVTENTDVVSPLASGLLPGIQGLHIGKVTKLDEDPTKENKIQVEIPLLNGEKNTIWARLTNFWASNQYGSFFIPDIGDEVVLGFFNNDPCHAVILGSLYSSKQAPPYSISAKNNARAIVTKSKLKIEFEEEKKIITIETPGKNIIEISDEGKSIKLTDQNENKIEMTASGISIESAKEIKLKAKTNITLDAGANLDIKAKSNVSIKGINIEANANAAFTAKGNAKAELSASGQTVVKGAIVMIN